MPTIKDVARLAGVSPSTVSRVLSQHPAISEATRERVRRALAELNYQPNAIARSLVRQKSQILGLAIDRPTGNALANPFFPEVIRGIGDGAREAGYDLLLVSAQPGEQEDHCLRLLRTRVVAGLIVSTPRQADRLLRQVVRENWPVVVIGRPPTAMPVAWVNTDNVQDAYRATDYLIRLGHRRIAFLGGPAEFLVSQDRREGYRRALRQAGIRPQPARWEAVTDFTQEGGYKAMAELRSRDPALTAALAIDDQVALGALRFLQEVGVPVPERFSLIGFNDDPVARLVRPRLTTTSLPIYDMGRLAVRQLVQRIEQADSLVEGTVVRTEFHERETTGPAPET